MLGQLVVKIPNLKLIVIDTFSEHFRATDMSYADRKKMIASALSGLQQIADKHKLCVVLINNMKTGRRDAVQEAMQAGKDVSGPIG